MPGVSRAPACKAALFDLFTTDPSLGAGSPAIQVTYGFLPRDPESETVVVGRIEFDSEAWAQGIGTLKREENFWVYLYVFVTTAGKTQQQVTERAFEILGFVELLLQQKPNVLGAGVPGVNWQELEPLSAPESPTDEGFQTMIEARIKVKARK